ncbi:hypothetical protein [Pedobacter insulae]|uniref:Uncharacterized protein n=1 Tax=Pedobacter insulae TaxID=414048 RepID=A0A1I2ZAC5_9SPHI|nr:hypothetical protein [Pedobacter insulae]SFH34858.1 hypothetical protein SAMN04489864_109110 [Pedobacter insulae]
MKSTLSKVKKMNGLITNRIIELQDQGYLYDFMSVGKQQFLCLQDSVCFHAPDVSIKLIDQLYDQVDKCYKYMHAVETASGCKGLLLEGRIYTN